MIDTAQSSNLRWLTMAWSPSLECFFSSGSIPIPFAIGPCLGFGKYVYNPEVFFCEDEIWTVQSSFSAGRTAFFILSGLIAPFLVSIFLNWSVYKAAKLQANVVEVQVGRLAGSESQQQEMSRQRIERKAAVDVSIIIAAFLLCFLPGWIVGIWRQFARSIKVPAQVVQVTSCVFIVSSLCNPIIHSIRKKEFRTGVEANWRFSKL